MKTLVKYFLCFTLALVMHSVAIAQLHHRDKPLPCLNKTFYIHVHILLNPDGLTDVDAVKLEQALEEASVYFEPICTKFEICTYDTIPNYVHSAFTAGGVERLEMIAKFQVPNRINLYVVDGISIQCGDHTQGTIASPKAAALFMAKRTCIIPKVLAHQLGHVFGLLHTYRIAGAKELVDGSNCTTAGDKICDTAADPYRPVDSLALYLNYNCEFIFEERDANNQYYQPLVGNLMSAYPGNCACGFTYDQLALMANNYLNSPEKIW